MSLNFETSVIINETTKIKLIEWNKKKKKKMSLRRQSIVIPGYCYVQMIISPSNAC